MWIKRLEQESAHGGNSNMSCIYNEKVKRSVTPLVCLLVVFGLSLLTVSYYGTRMGLSQEMKTALDLVLTMFFLLAGYATITKAREVYRYSIIADDLLIHRINGDKNHLVEKVRLSDIRSLERRISKKSLVKVIRNNYSENVIKLGCCCEYHEEGSDKSFYFSPSKSMLNKINNSLKAL